MVVKSLVVCQFFHCPLLEGGGGRDIGGGTEVIRTLSTYYGRFFCEYLALLDYFLCKNNSRKKENTFYCFSNACCFFNAFY